jgi:uncharacterized protein YqjF (DUF2071 family)
MTQPQASATAAADLLTGQLSELARARLLSQSGEPLFIAGWRRVLMIHLEVDPVALQKAVPFTLDLYQGRAFVSLVSFTLEGFRPRLGGRWAAALFKPIATHDFLNVRTYVCHDGEPGIHFLAEWLTNRLAVKLGPATFGLPYRFGKITYQLQPDREELRGRVVDVRTQTELSYSGRLPPDFRLENCEPRSLTEWLMERYSAYNAAAGRKKFFRVWHPSWPQREARIALHNLSLLTKPWPWFAEARLVGANYSPGFPAVWMGRPHGIRLH